MRVIFRQHRNARNFQEELSGFPGQIFRLRYQLFSRLCHLMSCPVQGCHQKVGRTGAHDQFQAFFDPVPAYQAAFPVQHGALRKAAQRFMCALCTEIRAQRYRTSGTALRKIQMRAVRLVYQQRNTVRMADLCDSPDIAADPVIRRAYQKHRADFRVLFQRLFHRFRTDSPRNVPGFQIFRLHPHGNRPAEHQPHQNRFMRVSGNKYFFPLPDRGKDHRLVAAGRSVDQKPAAVGSEQIRRQRLRLVNNALRLMQIIQAFRLCQIRTKSLAAQKFTGFFICSAVKPVTGNPEISRILLLKFFYCI